MPPRFVWDPKIHTEEITAVMERLRGHGVRFGVARGELVVDAPRGALSRGDRELLAHRKWDLLASLRRRETAGLRWFGPGEDDYVVVLGDLSLPAPRVSRPARTVLLERPSER